MFPAGQCETVADKGTGEAMIVLFLFIACPLQPSMVRLCRANQEAWVEQMKPDRFVCVDTSYGPECDAFIGVHYAKVYCVDGETMRVRMHEEQR